MIELQPEILSRTIQSKLITNLQSHWIKPEECSQVLTRSVSLEME